MSLLLWAALARRAQPFQPPFLASIRRPTLLWDTSYLKTFVELLDHTNTLNEATADRTRAVSDLIVHRTLVDKDPIKEMSDHSWSTPARETTMRAVAPGTWKVVYAPHMAFGKRLFGLDGLDVSYSMRQDGTCTSHALLSGLLHDKSTIALSASGTYSSVSDTVCRIEWEEAWVRVGPNDDDDKQIYFPTIEDVPDSIQKEVIRRVGRLLFIRPFSVFPVSFLNNEWIVFEFDLLGTRIVARKQ